MQEYIVSLAEGRTVLDVGCVDHSASTSNTDTWLHKHIREHASYVLGIDRLETEVEKLRTQGYNIQTGDAATMRLDQQFDMVVAGEIVEHVDDAASFLRNMARHLKPGGRIVLTTPNVFFLLHPLEAWFSEPARRWNPEHVAWFDVFTLGNLLQRCGFQVEQVGYFARSRKTRTILRLLRASRCPMPFASTLAVVGVWRPL